ncbi:738_t:CDS:2 [Acaulospora colombiana]|uniref:738_t:CDS:1 n=1 Tax=Acaulospora colombiana TaxID=27376 RepID=A0ACA9MDW5_9GLOM|nr:738_t:CDS:2 [Acaulospora colombiana]
MSDSVDLVQRFDAAFKALFYNKSNNELSRLHEVFLNLPAAQKSLIHTRMKDAFEQTVSRMKPALTSDISETKDDSFLEAAVNQWMILCEQMMTIKNNIPFMDPAFQALGKASIWYNFSI